MNPAGTHYIYMLHSSGGRLYTGYTTDPVRRLAEHLTGRIRAARFTRAFSPKGLAACWSFSCSRGEALKIEAAVKKLSRREKLVLLERNDRMERLAEECCGRYVALQREEAREIEKSARQKLGRGSKV